MTGPLAVVSLALALGAPVHPRTTPAFRTASDDIVRTTTAIATEITAREYRLVRVPVPDDFSGTDSVRFDVEPSRDGLVAGAMHGWVHPGDHQAILLSISARTVAAAGDREAAVLVFRGEGTGEARVVRVPLVVRIAPRRMVTAEPERGVYAVKAGGRVALRYRVRNAGNTEVRLIAAYTAPARWRARSADVGPLDLAAGDSRWRTITVEVPGGEDEGSYSVRVVLTDATGASTRLDLLVQVTRDSPAGVAHAPLLTTSVATTSPSAEEQGASAVAFVLNGVVGNGILVDGHAGLMTSTGDAASARTLGALGFVRRSDSFSARTESWNARVGALALDDFGLAGRAAGGTGVGLGLTSKRWSVAAGSAHPVESNGSYLEIDGMRRLGTLRLNGVVTDYADRFGTARHLTAAAFGLSSDNPGFRWSAQLARRTTDAGSGVGALLDIRQRSAQGSFQIRLSDAPGGSRGFAAAQRELEVSASRQLLKSVELSGSAWNSSDASETFHSLVSTGANIQPRWRVLPWLALGADARHNAFDARGTNGSLVSRDDAVGASVDVTTGSFGFAARTTFGRATRGASADASPVERSVTRFQHRIAASYNSRYAEFDAEVDAEHNGAGIGLPTFGTTQSVRASKIVIPVAGLPMYASIDYTRTQNGAESGPIGSLLVGLDASLPGSVLMTLRAEHNPLFYPRGARVPWVFGVRFARAAAVRLLTSGSRGTVFEDRNGNGVRDPGEPGVAGAVVRTDGRTVVTDGRGRFLRSPTAKAEVDLSSLPEGWITSPGSGTDIGVVPTGAVSVRVRVVADTLGNRPDIQLERVVVAVFDAAGRRWAGRPGADSIAHFDALPPGDYRVVLESLGTEAAVQPDATERPVSIRAGAGTQVEFSIGPRRIRIQRLQQGGKGAAAPTVPSPSTARPPA